MPYYSNYKFFRCSRLFAPDSDSAPPPLTPPPPPASEAAAAAVPAVEVEEEAVSGGCKGERASCAAFSVYCV
jgi:hypothetical protein